MFYKGTVVPMASHGTEMWGLRETERRKIHVFETARLRSVCELTLWNRVRNEVRRRVQVERQLSGRADQCVPRWFGYMERMDEKHMTKKVMNSDVEGNMCRGRPKELDG